VNFNGTGTVAIRASGNVSSITDNGTGDYTVNFTTAMPDANYAAVSMSRSNGAGSTTALTVEEHFSTSPANNAIRINTKQSATFADTSSVHVAIFR
jgi:hypothetical protein